MSKRSMPATGAPSGAAEAEYDPLSDRFLLEDEVASITGLSRTTRWREARKGSFPKPRALSAGRIGWLASEVRQWMAARTAAPQLQGATNAS